MDSFSTELVVHHLHHLGLLQHHGLGVDPGEGAVLDDQLVCPAHTESSDRNMTKGGVGDKKFFHICHGYLQRKYLIRLQCSIFKTNIAMFLNENISMATNDIVYLYCLLDTRTADGSAAHM